MGIIVIFISKLMKSFFVICLIAGCLFAHSSHAQNTMIPGTEYFGFSGTHLVGKQEVLATVEENGGLYVITSTHFKTAIYEDHRLNRQNDSTYVFESGMVVRKNGTWIYRDSLFKMDIMLQSPVPDNKELNYFRNNAFASLCYKHYTDSLLNLYAWKMVDFESPYNPVHTRAWMVTLSRDMPYPAFEKLVKEKLAAQLVYYLKSDYRIFRNCIKLEEETADHTYKTVSKIADEAALYSQIISAEPFTGTDTTHYTRRLAFYDTHTGSTGYMYVSGNRISIGNRVFILKKDMVL